MDLLWPLQNNFIIYQIKGQIANTRKKNQQLMAQQKPTLLSNHIGKVSSPEMERKVKQMIRKKASLYGIQELANPHYNKANQILLFASKLVNKNMRSNSSLASVPSSKILSAREKNLLGEDGDPIVKAAAIPSYKLDSKTNQEKLFPPLNDLRNLIDNSKEVLYVFRDKLDYDLNDVVYEYLKVLQLAIAYQSQIFVHKITLHKGILIHTLEFLAQSLLQCQFIKIVLVFAVIGLNLCQFYKQLDRVGKFLFITSKVLRKMQKYEECQVVLKKSLEYVWHARRELNTNGEEKISKERNLANLCQDQKDHNVQNANKEKYKDASKNQKQHKRNKSSISVSQNQRKPLNHAKSPHKQPELKHMYSSTNQHMQSSSQLQSQVKRNQRHSMASNQPFLEPHKQVRNLEEEYAITELQIYNELSYCLLQLNKKQQSKVFGEKYQIGYLEKQSNSSVVTLSKDLISSAQKRIIAWQRVDKRRFDLVFGIELDKYLVKYGQTIKDKFQQNKFIKALKVNIQLLIDNLFKKDLFFYQVPLITELKDTQLQQYKKFHHKLPVLTQKFVYKKKSLTQGGRTASIPIDLKKFNNQSVGGNKIFNYRGVGLSRTKLTNLFRDYIKFLQGKILSPGSNNGKLPSIVGSVKTQIK